MRTVRKLLVFIFILFLFVPFFPVQGKAYASTSCPGINPLTDPLAIKMENGVTLIWDKVNPNLLTAKAKYDQLLKAKGWKITYSSAYRPLQYQQHFYEIVHAPSSTCKNNEIKKHGLTGVVAAPNPNAPHVKGIAFDATVYDQSGRALNGKNFVSSSLLTVAKQAGLQFTVPTSDGVHHELISTPKQPTPAETAMNAKGKIISENGFNVRNAPSATATRLGGVYKNDIVQIVAKSGDWYKINFGNGYGYIMAVQSGLALIDDNQEQAFIAKGQVTTASGVNVRSSHSVTATRIGGLNNGAYVDIVAKYGDWYKIKFAGGYGWIMGSNGYVKIISTPPAATTLQLKYYVILYSQPSFSSTNHGAIAPQTVNVLKNNGNGWYQITSWAGTVWIFINPNPVKELQTDKNVTLFDQPWKTAASHGEIGPQKVTVLVDRGDGWYQISTYRGPEWIYFVKSITTIPVNTGTSGYPYKTLTLGAGTNEVLWLQFLLVYNGYHIGDRRFSDGYYMKDYCDGGFGQNTLNGLNAFKKQNGLAVVSNGLVDTMVWKALEKKIRQDYPDNDFINSLHFTLIHEGGYSNYSSDPGGATYFGIAKTMNNWPGDIRTITPSAIVNVYRTKYWNGINSNKMTSSSMKLVLFDSYVLYGAGGGNSRGIVKWMQQLLGIPADGGWGTNTWNAFNQKHADNKSFAFQLANKRVESDNSFPNSSSKTGWLNRDRELIAFLNTLPN